MTEEILDNIFTLAAKHFQTEKSNIEMDALVVDDLGADSLDIVELTMELETLYNISISDEVAQKIVTIKDLVAVVEERLNKKN